MKVLIVDDDTSIRKLQEMILTRAQHEVVEAESAGDAFDILQNDVIDLVILDIVMPEMTGIDLLRKKNDDPRISAIPVVLCSSVADLERVKEAMQLGIAAYLLKPISARDLLEKVRLAEKRIQPVLEDPATMVERLGLDIPGYRKLVHLMIDDATERLEEIGKRIEDRDGDCDGLESFTRDLSNTSSNLGAYALSAAAREASEALLAADAAKREQYLSRLKFEIDRVREAAVKDISIRNRTRLRS